MTEAGRNNDLGAARKLMDDYARRTGITNTRNNADKRYLWTDAFAVQTFFGLAHASGDDACKELAVKLIGLVHEKLGRYSLSDTRKGWISGLPEEAGKKHPTAGGLRIGKRLPEREPGEPFHEQQEWERDGQYFHYITRWINTLLQAELETGESRYADWAAELTLAGGRFIHRNGIRPGMYWKMSVDLTRPLVPSMGAHDPLEGLVCAVSAVQAAPHKAQELAKLTHDFKELCQGRDWSTTDALGIGGLLLNTARAIELSASQSSLPDAIRPRKLLSDCLYGLSMYERMHDAGRPASHRLAFRECGLSLGLRTLSGLKGHTYDPELNLDELEKYMHLAGSIENFWRDPVNQQASTWTSHLDINAVSLAASLVARQYPFAFCAVKNARQ